jgi:hypothetical protein
MRRSQSDQPLGATPSAWPPTLTAPGAEGDAPRATSLSGPRPASGPPLSLLPEQNATLPERPASRGHAQRLAPYSHCSRSRMRRSQSDQPLGATPSVWPPTPTAPGAEGDAPRASSLSGPRPASGPPLSLLPEQNATLPERPASRGHAQRLAPSSHCSRSRRRRSQSVQPPGATPSVRPPGLNEALDDGTLDEDTR